MYGVILGEHDVSVESGTELRRNVSDILTNENFTLTAYNNDIALLKVRLYCS